MSIQSSLVTEITKYLAYKMLVLHRENSTVKVNEVLDSWVGSIDDPCEIFP